MNNFKDIDNIDDYMKIFKALIKQFIMKDQWGVHEALNDQIINKIIYLDHYRKGKMKKKSVYTRKRK